MQKRIIQFINYFIFFIISTFCFSQNAKIDSLLNVIKTAKEDTTKVNTLNELFSEYEYEDDKKAEECLNKAFLLSKKNRYQNGLACTYVNKGSYAEDKGNYPEALKNYAASLKIREALGDKENIAISYNYIGSANLALGNYPDALKNFFSCLKIMELIGNKKSIASLYNNIGIVYNNQNNYTEALKNYNASLKIKKEIGDKKGEAASYNNIGAIYNFQGNYSEALNNYRISLKIWEELGDKMGISRSYNNIGSAFNSQGNYAEALKNHFASLKIKEEIGSKSGIAASYINIASVYSKLNKSKEAEQYLNKSKMLSKEYGLKKYLKDAYLGLTILDSAKRDFKGAYENHKLYILYRDSLDNEETRKKTVQSQMTYDFEKKEAVATAEHKKELENQKMLAEEKSRKQKIVILFVVCGLLLVLVFAGFIFRSLRITRKQKNTIEKQKQIVDEKNFQLNQQNEEISTQRDEIEAQRDEIEAQRDLVTEQKDHIEEIHKEVTDSINYAKRIQEAVLPVSDAARSVLGEHFILFKPKDIVSGDFYFTTKVKNWLIVAVADCTGHGVPGAFMSMLGISFLNEIVQKQEINKANQILNHLRVEIINALQQKGVQGEQKDGMDISLLVVNIETNECQWAGANNPLYIVARKQSTVSSLFSANCLLPTEDWGLFELKGDKMPIAIYPMMKDFTNHELTLSKGDSIFLFTDGFADQFGGPKGRKFMYKQFKEILLHNSHKQMAEQKEILENAFENWKGNTEQIDDITVLGIRI